MQIQLEQKAFFELHKLADQTALKNIYAKDGKHAINSILTLVDFQ